ncbi:hypothetical protein ACQKLP_10360 [Chitinophaga sp. NPDC101104]|uniref:hypothetical protein n=1 Tax=Chitinophaga sp. NPDC101104 TaxID=3390561 RepID=UPI003CFEFA8D
MSIFDYPRINFKGLISINVGTANNDDYSGEQFASGPYAGQPVRLADSASVQPMTYGMTDDAWVNWAITPLGVYNPPPANPCATTARRFEGERPAPAAEFTVNDTIFPGEWNYYGDMGLDMIGVNVTGINDPNNIMSPALKSQISVAQLSFLNRSGPNGRSTGMVIDINPEDPTNTQLYTDFLSLIAGDTALFMGKPSKAMTRWINFFKNGALTGPNGAAAMFQCVIPLSELTGQPILQGMPSNSPTAAKKPLAGIVCRFTVYRPLQKINVFKYKGQAYIDQMNALYAVQGTNSDFLEIQGTVAPWFEGDATSQTTGRYLEPQTFPWPIGWKGNTMGAPKMQMPPAILYYRTDDSIYKISPQISLDLSPVLPDLYMGNYDPMVTGNNPKFDLGAISLMIGDPANPQSPNNFTLGQINYMDVKANDANGWIFDFGWNAFINARVREGQPFFLYCTGPMGISQVIHVEKPLFLFSETSGVYAEQNTANPNATTTQFRDYGPGTVPISFIGYKNGEKLTNNGGYNYQLWYYDTTPNQAPGNAVKLQDNYNLGDPIALPVSKKGNVLITCTTSDNPPPSCYAEFNPLTGSIINVRVLPNDEDYSQYYKDPGSPQPTGNDKLTWDVVYSKVLRNYYLLYPAMSQVVKLNDPNIWKDPVMARALMDRISLAQWANSVAMPRTRDLSDSRRKLLTAWCLKIINP